MTEGPLSDLIQAMGVAVFERLPDGTFRSVTPAPAWFAPLAADGTFPFLGHILEEASDFWQSGRAGREDYGPCAEVDDRGREFHYTISAVSAGERRYLWFALDPASDRMRTALQRARETALRAEAALKGASDRSAHEAVAEAAAQIKSLVLQLAPAEMPGQQRAIVQALLEVSERLVYAVDHTRRR
jgi:hypothetical protein